MECAFAFIVFPKTGRFRLWFLSKSSSKAVLSCTTTSKVLRFRLLAVVGFACRLCFDCAGCSKCCFLNDAKSVQKQIGNLLLFFVI